MVLRPMVRPGEPGTAVHSPPDFETVVIGAGPHGLSAVAHLRRAGIETHILGEPMSFWKAMPHGMLLRSNMSATNMIEPSGPLSLASFVEAGHPSIEAPVPLDRFIEYGTWVQGQIAPDVDRREVARLESVGGGFRITLTDGETVQSRRVVLACGIAGFAHVPPGFAELPGDLVSHSSEHTDPTRFAGQSVTIVGRGQSAFELAALIMEGGAEQVEVLVRADHVVWLRGHSVKKAIGPLGPVVYAPTDVGPLWYSRLLERPALFGLLPRRLQNRIAARAIRPACSHFVRVRLDPVRISTDIEIVSAQADDNGLSLDLSDGSHRRTDHLILATGYRVEFSRYPFLDASILDRVRVAHGYPLLRSGLEASLDGLHVMGAPAAWSFGPIMRFVSGSWYAGRSVAAAVAAARSAPRRAI